MNLCKEEQKCPIILQTLANILEAKNELPKLAKRKLTKIPQCTREVMRQIENLRGN